MSIRFVLLVVVFGMLVGTSSAALFAGNITAGGYNIRFPGYATVDDGMVTPTVEVDGNQVTYTLSYTNDMTDPNSLFTMFVVVVNPMKPMDEATMNVTGSYNGFTIGSGMGGQLGAAMKEMGNVRVGIVTSESNGNLINMLDNTHITKL